MKTFVAKPETVKRDWYVVDATGKTLGRLATELARRLRGKHKAEYTPHVDTGDYIIVINAEKVAVTGKKETDKIYYWHTGYVGGIQRSQPSRNDCTSSRSSDRDRSKRYVTKRSFRS